MSFPRKIFIDSDAFVALAREDDAHHEKAIALLNRLTKESAIIITSNYVFTESITVISMRKSHEAAVEYIRRMKETDSNYTIQQVDADIEALAIEIFKKQTSKNTSFVDCTNMAFLQAMKIDAIFSFDEVYSKNGFALVSDLR